MQAISLLLFMVLGISLACAALTFEDELVERYHVLDGLPIYVKDTLEDPNQRSIPQYKLDTTSLVFIVKQSVDPHSWNNPGIVLESVNYKGKDSLRICQTRLQHEKIAGLLSELKKISPYFTGNQEVKVVP